MNTDIIDENGISTSGVTVFYKQFYARLTLFDTAGEFEAILTKNTHGANKMAAKGAILLRIMKYILLIDGSQKEQIKSLVELGKSHAKKGIRPWQYSTFIDVLIQTVSSCLQEKATDNTMSCWVNLFAFCFQTMLPHAIKNQVNECEIHVNTATVFQKEAVADKKKAVPANNDRKFSSLAEAPKKDEKDQRLFSASANTAAIINGSAVAKSKIAAANKDTLTLTDP
jgi:hemoglobin-like flavoprotein